MLCNKWSDSILWKGVQTYNPTELKTGFILGWKFHFLNGCLECGVGLEYMTIFFRSDLEHSNFFFHLRSFVAGAMLRDNLADLQTEINIKER